MSKPDFPIAIDSSMMESFIACPYKFKLQYLDHWKPSYESVHLIAGKAFAAGIEAIRLAYWKRGETIDACLAAGFRAAAKEWGDYVPPEGQPKTFDTIIGALDAYFQHYGFSTDYILPYMHGDTPAVEFSFALPIPDVEHPQTGDSIIKSGRFDMIGVYNGAAFIVDEKTTQRLGPTWVKNWNMRPQLTGYCWAAREFGYPVQGAIIRGISILKNSYGHAESIQYRPEWFIDLWLKELQQHLRRMVEYWERDEWPHFMGGACTAYSGCSYQPVCMHARPEQALESQYIKRVWDPLKREETDE